MKSRTIIAFLRLFSMGAIAAGAAYKMKSKNQEKLPPVVVERTKDARMKVVDFPKHGVSVHDMSDGKYDHEYRYVFRTSPDVDADVRKFAVIIENSAKVDIVALSVLWQFEFTDRPPYRLQYQYHTVDWLLTDAMNQQPILRTGGKKSFLGIRDSGDFWKLNGIVEIKSFTDNEKVRLSRLNALVNAADSYRFEIEGVLFADGTIIGSNSQHFAECTMATYNAPRDLINQFAGKSDAQILVMTQDIAKISDKDLRAPFADAKDYYNNPLFVYENSKLSFARQLASIGEARGLPAMMEYLATMQRGQLISMQRK